jgi:hypothetical protein
MGTKQRALCIRPPPPLPPLTLPFLLVATSVSSSCLMITASVMAWLTERTAGFICAAAPSSSSVPGSSPVAPTVLSVMSATLNLR